MIIWQIDILFVHLHTYLQITNNMKKVLLSLLLVAASATTIVAQTKSYVTVFCPLNSYSSMIKLSGDIPGDMKSDYSYMDFGNPRAVNNYYLIGQVLNMLASHGFQVEKMDSWCNDQTDYTMYLCAKSADSGVVSSAKQQAQIGDADDIREIARYNLQGIPVSPADKGIQIIVYSNYTTKTVVVE